MSENSSEYLKRTCLICGCHTNQTINIYEPRSGPNIVQLIQAKFKFQPLNEDKYLCFSCNNWLINWHSLQALNSNDAESPSGTFRSHLNSGNVMQDEKSSGSKKPIAVCRPVAHVKPLQIPATPSDGQQEEVPAADSSSTEAAQQEPVTKASPRINFNKRHFRMQLCRRGRLQYKSTQLCACGKFIVIRRSCPTKVSKAKSPSHMKCRKCRELSRMKANYMRSIIQVESELAIREAPLQPTRNLVAATGIATEHQRAASPQLHEQQQRRLHLPKPTVDGKVVAMLRRLGTSLSREPHNGSGNCSNERLPQIMSPTKPTSKWQRPLEDDEILVNFDTSISEVLPSLADQFTHVNSIAARKRLTFQVSETAEVIDLCEEDSHMDDDGDDVDDYGTEEGLTQQGLQLANNFTSSFVLPKGLSITIANAHTEN